MEIQMQIINARGNELKIILNIMFTNVIMIIHVESNSFQSISCYEFLSPNMK